MSQNNKELRLAVLIDADNVPASAIKEMMDEIAKHGFPTFKRIYGDFTSTQLGSWKDVLNEYAITPMQQYRYTTGKNASDSALIIDAMDVLNEYAITPMQQYRYTTGKNASDSALIIDAMDMLHTAEVDGFFIVSSDSDFTKLATRLREGGKRVFGMGEKKTPMPFIKACEQFIYIELLRAPLARAKSATGAKSAPLMHAVIDSGTDLKKLMISTIEDFADDSGWVAMSGLGSGLQKRLPEFDARNYGVPRLSDLVRTLPYLEVLSRDGGGGNKHDYVRVKRKA